GAAAVPGADHAVYHFEVSLGLVEARGGAGEEGLARGGRGVADLGTTAGNGVATCGGALVGRERRVPLGHGDAVEGDIELLARPPPARRVGAGVIRAPSPALRRGGPPPPVPMSTLPVKSVTVPSACTARYESTRSGVTGLPRKRSAFGTVWAKSRRGPSRPSPTMRAPPAAMKPRREIIARLPCRRP